MEALQGGSIICAIFTLYFMLKTPEILLECLMFKSGNKIINVIIWPYVLFGIYGLITLVNIVTKL